MVIHGFSRVSLCWYLLVIHEEFPVARLPIECIANADVRALRIWEAELAVAAVANIWQNRMDPKMFVWHIIDV